MRVSAWLGLAALLGAPGSAAPATPFRVDCVAPLGAATTIRTGRPGPAYRLRGRMRPVELENVPDPSQPMRITGNDVPHVIRYAEAGIGSADWGRSLTLRLEPRYAANGTGDLIADVVVRTRRGGHEASQVLTTIASHSMLWDWLTFDIAAGGGQVIVSAGGRQAAFALDVGANAELSVGCIGGTYDLQSVDWDG